MKKVYLIVKLNSKRNILSNVAAYDNWNDADNMCSQLNILAYKRKEKLSYIMQVFTI